MGIEVKEVLMNPGRAANHLKKHDALVAENDEAKNRRCKPNVVDRYARDMQAGKWDLNAETIKIGKDGRIIDGQHRLRACVKSDCSFRTLVAENVSDEAYKTVDIGTTRTMADGLYISGHKHAAVLAGALSLMWRWERGDGKAFDAIGQSPTKQEQYEVLQRHTELVEFLNRAKQLSDLMSASLATVLWYLFNAKDETLAAAFFEALRTGQHMSPNDPVYVLRERLIKDRGLRPRPSVYEHAELIIRAWTATRRGEKLAKLQRPRTDAGRPSKNFQIR
jgi:hypothetical protein